MIPMLLLSLALGEPTQITYAAFRCRVECLQPGQTLTLTVGSDFYNGVRCDDAKNYGIDAGSFTCWSDGGVPKMVRIGAAGQQSVPQIAPFNVETLRYNLSPGGTSPRCIGNT